MKRLGALWTTKSKEGKKYLNGVIEFIPGIHTRIAVFVNEKKKDKKEPDFNIVVLEERKEDKVKISEESIF